ncbi:MAG: Wzz/FepE/Etk N-terminal domain-containing protein [Pseudonocardia sp.]
MRPRTGPFHSVVGDAVLGPAAPASTGGGMELRDYARMLRRGWPVVLLVMAIFAGLAAAYLAVAPRHYEARAVLFVSTSQPESVVDLQQGSQFAANAATTYSVVVDSPTVLGAVADESQGRFDVDELVEMVSTSVPKSTTLVNVVVNSTDPVEAATIADAAAAAAARVLPTLEVSPDGDSLVRVQQIERAVEPVDPVSPDAARVLAVGLIAGLCVGLGVTVTMQSLDTRIRRPEDVREHTAAPVVAVIPQLTRSGRLAKLFGRSRHQGGLVVRDAPLGAASEAFRILRTNLRWLEATDRRSLVVTSVDEDPDGAKVPANLAWSLAQAGRRVLLVDLDLRQPGVGDTLGVESDRGVADVLSGHADLGSVVLTTAHPRLEVALPGHTTLSPSDLLSAPILTGVLRRMEHEYDHVILHCPPLRSYSDAVVVSGIAGGTVVCVTTGRTRAHELATALGALANVGVAPSGLVLTRAERSSEPDRPALDEPLEARAVPATPAATTMTRRVEPRGSGAVRTGSFAVHTGHHRTQNGGHRPVPAPRGRPRH